MPEKCSLRAFDLLYQKAVDEIYLFWAPAMQDELAAHNAGWSSDTAQFDFDGYLRASAVRYYRAYTLMPPPGDGMTVCDVGGFWGAFPITLRQLGYNVTMTESLRYYSDGFDALFEYVKACGVEIVDYDPFTAQSSLGWSFDFITVMAVLEHYPHSLRTFMSNLTSIMEAGAQAYIEVPNIAYWPKRLAMLRGVTPLVPVREIYRSETPFIGHHHEFTIAELKDLVRLAGLTIESEHLYNYSIQPSLGVKPILSSLLERVIFAMLPDTREVLAVLCRKSRNSSTTDA